MIHSPGLLITKMGSISPLGSNSLEVAKEYSNNKSSIISKLFEGKEFYVSPLQSKDELEIEKIKNEKKVFSYLDRSVILALMATRSLIKNFSSIDFKNKKVAVNIGSSRGATSVFEKGHGSFLQGEKLSPFTSPTSTLGNISSWVAQELMPNENSIATIEHSMTCSTFLQGVGNAMAWLKSDQSDLFFVGASEAPLTSFTLSQLNSLKICKKFHKREEFPSQPLGEKENSGNSIVLGEGASLFLLENCQDKKTIEECPPRAIIESIGFGIENISSPTSINKEGLGFQHSMKNAINNMSSKSLPDLVIVHAPGTKNGDEAEIRAIEKIFPKGRLPFLTSNKWKIGHTLASSAALSLEMAILILQGNNYHDLPYPPLYGAHFPVNEGNKKINKIMINSAGFGGTTASLIVTRPEF